jgi:hypothetical protein
LSRMANTRGGLGYTQHSRASSMKTLTCPPEHGQYDKLITDVFKLLGLERPCDFEDAKDLLKKKVKKMWKFCHKVNKLVNEVEGKRVESLSECLNWIRGLLSDFCDIKNKNKDLSTALNKFAST